LIVALTCAKKLSVLIQIELRNTLSGD